MRLITTNKRFLNLTKLLLNQRLNQTLLITIFRDKPRIGIMNTNKNKKSSELVLKIPTIKML